MNRALALPPLRALPQPAPRLGLLGVRSLQRQFSRRTSYRVAWGLALVVVIWEGSSLLLGTSNGASVPGALWIIMWCTTFIVGLTLNAVHSEVPLVRLSRVRGRDAMMGRWMLPALRFRVALGLHGGATVVLALASLSRASVGVGSAVVQLVALLALSFSYSVVLSAWATVCQWVLPAAAGRLFWLTLIVPALFHSALVDLPSLQDVMSSLTERAVEGTGP